jgi:hypothetical protein
MSAPRLPYPGQLRAEIARRNRLFARNQQHVESYGASPVIIYAPEGSCHGNFYPPAYAAIANHAHWIRRFDKIHAQGRSIPRSHIDPARRWRELDSCMSSDALLMNLFCTPEVIASLAIQRMLGVDSESEPIFGWKARVPLNNGRFDRTEVDMRWGNLLVEAKLTESDFQIREVTSVQLYRDLDEVFDRDLLPRVPLRVRRRRDAIELAEEFTQEWEEPSEAAENIAREFQASLEARADAEQPWLAAFAGYQLIRNVLAAFAAGTSFCVIHDERRPDLREAWFDIMRAVKNAEMRVRCKTISWQEIVPFLPPDLRHFLDIKYGIVGPGQTPLAIEDLEAQLYPLDQAGMRK